MAENTDFDTVEHSNYVLKGRVSAPEVYADGLSHFVLFGSMAKMLLHSISWPKRGKVPEFRRAVLNLTMPAANAIELAHFILTAAKNSETRLLAGMDPDQAEKIRDMLKDIPSKMPVDIRVERGIRVERSITGEEKQ
jgi:hypothetical protein